jgi:hypothetical protein
VIEQEMTRRLKVILSDKSVARKQIVNTSGKRLRRLVWSDLYRENQQ